MPKFFEEWLKSLTEEQANAMWDYFDGCPTAAEDVASIIAVVWFVRKEKED